MAPDRIFNLGFHLATTISILVLVSLGLAVIFGMRGVINLAHGEFIMLGAFATLTGVRSGLNIWPAMALAALVVGAFGIVIERLLIRHLYGRLADTMLATWGLSLILVQAVENLYGSVTEGLAVPVGNLTFGEFSMSTYNLVLMAAAGAGVLATRTIMRRSRYGLLARAATQSPTMAEGLGVNTSAVNMWTFGLGSALAGAAGALLAPVVGVIPTMGQTYVARAFMAVIVGGPSFLAGTASASGLLGFVENVGTNWFTPVIGQAMLLMAAIVMLRFRPQGLTGTRLGR
ncbi:ABC transporter permease subunit [Candidatus Poriferisodalis sp.]|uniref:ABC transporter permease subunit n=1 Tax=Candidatus Poriferisodalis sp. TaxID=3101277 RepID=UPI003B026846